MLLKRQMIKWLKYCLKHKVSKNFILNSIYFALIDYLFINLKVKEKSELLIQLDELTNIKNELSLQIESYHINLEQEKSKVHQLEKELRKLKMVTYFRIIYSFNKFNKSLTLKL